MDLFSCRIGAILPLLMAMVAQADADGDGDVDFSEFLALMTQKIQGTEQLRQASVAVWAMQSYLLRLKLTVLIEPFRNEAFDRGFTYISIV